MVIASGAAKVIASGATKVIATVRTRRWFLRKGGAVVRARKDMHQLQELVRLHRLGVGAREVARLLQMSPNTEREYRESFSLS